MWKSEEWDGRRKIKDGKVLSIKDWHYGQSTQSLTQRNWTKTLKINKPTETVNHRLIKLQTPTLLNNINRSKTIVIDIVIEKHLTKLILIEQNIIKPNQPTTIITQVL